MGALDVHAAGPAEAEWRTRTEHLPSWGIPRGLHAVVVSPHPDDETLGLGGTLRRIVAAGGRIDLVAVTDGEASHPGTFGLADRRRQELRAALEALGIAGATRVTHLGLPDGAVVDHRATLSARLLQVAVDHGADASAAPASPDASSGAAARSGAGTCWFAPVVDDGHTDHDTVGAVVAGVTTARGLPLLRYPVWAWQWHDPATSGLLEGARRVELRPSDREAKRAAVAAYVSQTTAQDGRPPIVPSHVLDRLLRDHEVVVP